MITALQGTFAFDDQKIKQQQKKNPPKKQKEEEAETVLQVVCVCVSSCTKQGEIFQMMEILFFSLALLFQL